MTNFEHIYNEICDEVNNDITELSEDYKIVDMDEIDKLYYKNDFVIFNYVDEDNLTNEIDKLGYNIIRDGCLIFDTYKYLDYILKSYNYDETNILNQFNADCPRSKILINDKFVKNIKILKSLLSPLKNNKVKYNNNTNDLIIILTMLCTQSSYGFPYQLCHNILSNYENGIFISNMSTNRIICIDFKYDEKKNINNIEIRIESDFGEKNIFENKIKSKINISIILNIYKIKDKFEFTKNSMLFWDRNY
jgi:hypothetical protein